MRTKKVVLILIALVFLGIGISALSEIFSDSIGKIILKAGAGQKIIFESDTNITGTLNNYTIDDFNNTVVNVCTGDSNHVWTSANECQDITGFDTVATASASTTIGFTGAAATVAKGTTSYLGLGPGTVTSTEADANFYIPFDGTVSVLSVYVSANASNNNANSVIIRKNSANQTLRVIYDAAQTGMKTDDVNSFSVSAGDAISIQVINTASGGGSKNIVIETVTMKIAT